MENLSFWIGIIATIAFAVTGVLAIADRGVDLFGVMVLGLITAIGGGTLRDLILETPVFWASLPIYLWVALAASAITFYLEAFFTQPQIFRWMLYLDGFGAALFGIQGADKAWNMDFGLPLAPVILGVITAIGRQKKPLDVARALCHSGIAGLHYLRLDFGIRSRLYNARCDCLHAADLWL
jgi:uncharacterized membrane protein YeiH